MRRPTDEELLVGAVLALLLLRGRSGSSSRGAAIDATPALWPGEGSEDMSHARWVWPVPTYVDNDRRMFAAMVSSAHAARNPSRPKHNGVDIMFPRKGVVPQAAGDGGGGSPNWFAPSGAPVLAIADGTIWAVGEDTHGKWVRVDHGSVNGVPTSAVYRHLESTVDAPRAGAVNGRVVKAGDPIGVMGFDPSDKAKARHLHLEVLRGPKGKHLNVDPETLNMTAWARRTWAPTLPDFDPRDVVLV